MRVKIIVPGCCLILLFSCKQKSSVPDASLIGELDLKRGDVISCGKGDKEFGTVDFDMSCNAAVKEEFSTGVELLHSFEYDEAEKVFAKVINQSPDCIMAYWGVAMANYHPLWEPPTEHDLKKGARAVEIAKTISGQSVREKDYLTAIAAYYENWQKTDPRTRSINFANAMAALHEKYPTDKEAAIFYSLSLDASADPKDKTFANQLKAGGILNALYTSTPDHPGIAHYIIHTYDYPGLAKQGLDAAKKYAAIAPSSAHALHMPSHIFTRLGLWDESIQSNKEAVEAAKCYAETAGIKGHWDEELHSLDYLVYAYLQKGDNRKADSLEKYVDEISTLDPVNFKGAYTFAAVPARVALENKNWKKAACLELHNNFPWSKFPWQEAIHHFARLLGMAHLKDVAGARLELQSLQRLRDTLLAQKEDYRANQVAIQAKAGEAWLKFAEGNKDEAVSLAAEAATMEDNTSKHPVTPGEVLPARELYADLLVECGQNEKALEAYKAVLEKSPNRFNAVYGAAHTAELLGYADAEKYFELLSSFAASNTNRPEMQKLRSGIASRVKR